MMNLYQNYINRTILLSEDCYPCYKTPVYKVNKEELENFYAQGFLPEIKVNAPKENEHVKIAVILGQDKHPDRKEKDFTIHPSYVRAIVNAGGCPVFFTYDKVQEVLENYKPQGILLIGGFFHSPREWYVDDETDDLDKRGQAYIDALSYAKSHKLPLLGICAGMQMLGGFCGAKLKKGFKSHLVGGDEVAHNVKVLEKTLLAKISKTLNLKVNSHHSEVLVEDSLGDCVMVAQADDGVVEAIELKNPWNDFVLGLQWHPERDFPNSEDFRTHLFDAFVKACKVLD